MLTRRFSRLLSWFLAVASISVAVVGEATTVIVVAMALVAVERFEVDFIQNDSQEIVVDAPGRSVLRDVDLCFSLFDDKHEGINDMSCRSNVHQRSDEELLCPGTRKLRVRDG